ncbi:hypothetical protein, partial [Ideonella dechloratans]|uniref:hypothetical protein n=1 Tax=Ideonella dechloratans TaxID=36863 RepID=UPI0035B40C54
LGLLVTATWDHLPDAAQQARLQHFLALRLATPGLRVVHLLDPAVTAAEAARPPAPGKTTRRR